MQYSDDDVSVSGSEDDQHSFDSDEEYGDDENVDFDSEGDAGEDVDDPAAAAAATAAAAAGLPGSGKASSRDVTDALMSGQLSTQTALLQMEVCLHSELCCVSFFLHTSASVLQRQSANSACLLLYSCDKARLQSESQIRQYTSFCKQPLVECAVLTPKTHRPHLALPNPSCAAVVCCCYAAH
jgi:hypothetical protein